MGAPKTRRIWTDAELEILMAEFQSSSLSYIARKLGRTAVSVRYKAKQMGLQLDRSCTSYCNVDLSKVTDCQWAYFAGLLDGEGSIFILRGKQYSNGTPNHNLEVTITNTSRDLIDWLIATFGGTERISGGRGGRQRKQWAWVVRHHKAAIYLRSALPYLVIKRKQAKIALQFLETKLAVKIGTPLTTEAIGAYDAFKNEISQLNNRLI